MFQFEAEYDVIVVGGGHAGIEASLAAARMGCKTLLLTMNLDTIGQMSCNPAIGGVGKGHLVREIDALGGEMGKTTEVAGIQFRMLNTKKGPAVQSPRAQCDKKIYQFQMKWVCERQANLDIKQEQPTKLLISENVAYGVETQIGTKYLSQSVVITTGTFLMGLMHIGQNQIQGGRLGDARATGLSASLVEAGIKLGRFKTGTPPRIIKKSINFEKTKRQPGDSPAPAFSFWGPKLFHVEQTGEKIGARTARERIGGQVECYITSTTPKTADLIRANLHKSPLYSGKIEGVGPRYCPSIEDKIVKFASKDAHQVFLEPEGIETDEFYVNGLSTSLPYEVQIELVRSIVGCEQAQIIRPAYAVEYDYAYPAQLSHSLETKVCKNLFLAGQINGTSGYEEAAAQGLMAGINAARKVQCLSPIILNRDQAYIGVLIDDLITKEIEEPYRIFTSRAEYRMLLRQGNADMRLSELGYQIGLLPYRNYVGFKSKKLQIESEVSRLQKTHMGTDSLAKILSRPDVSYQSLPGPNLNLGADVVSEIETILKYQGYLDRQDKEIQKNKTLETKQIPEMFDYAAVKNISTEARQKLLAIKPKTIGQAARISGVSPADVSALIIFLRRWPTNLKQIV